MINQAENFVLLPRCSHCSGYLLTDREQANHVCFDCRRFGLLFGRWPESNERAFASELLTRTYKVHAL
jgi:hypothetical protein